MERSYQLWKKKMIEYSEYIINVLHVGVTVNLIKTHNYVSEKKNTFIPLRYSIITLLKIGVKQGDAD